MSVSSGIGFCSEPFNLAFGPRRWTALRLNHKIIKRVNLGRPDFLISECWRTYCSIYMLLFLTEQRVRTMKNTHSKQTDSQTCTHNQQCIAWLRYIHLKWHLLNSGWVIFSFCWRLSQAAFIKTVLLCDASLKAHHLFKKKGWLIR